MSDEGKPPFYEVGAVKTPFALTTPISPELMATVNPNKPPRVRKDGSIDRRAFSSKINGVKFAGRKSQPIKDENKTIEAAVEYVSTGASPKSLASHNGITENQAKAVVSLVQMAPEEFHARLAARMENVLEKLMADMERDTDKIKPRDRMLQTAIGIDKLLTLRGTKAPGTVHNTQININGMDRAAALALLQAKSPKVAAPVDV